MGLCGDSDSLDFHTTIFSDSNDFQFNRRSKQRSLAAGARFPRQSR